jgi:hypothetical protein
MTERNEPLKIDQTGPDMSIAVTQADKIGKSPKSTGRQLKASLVANIRKVYEKSKTTKPNTPGATAAGALVIAVAAGGILLLAEQSAQTPQIAANGATVGPGLVVPATRAGSLARATSNIPTADLGPVVKKAIAASAAKKFAELPTPIQISEVQRLLATLDFRPGPPDGVLGHRTVKAIRLYQKFGGLEITGHATPELLLDLRAVASRMPEPAG